MHRSGTSAAARVASLLGAELPSAVMGASRGNALGHWEPEEVVAVHDAMLESAGSQVFDVSGVSRRWFESRAAARFVDVLEDTVRKNYRLTDLSVVKDPRSGLFIPLWTQVFERLDADGAVLLPFRNPFEVARSLQAREQANVPEKTWPLSWGLLLWLRNVLDAEQATRGLKRSFLFYDDLLADWRGQTDRLARQLEIAWPRTDSAAASAAVDAYLRPDEKHETAVPNGWRKAAPTVAAVFDGLLACRDDPQGSREVFDRARAELDRAAAFYGEYAAALEHDRSRMVDALRGAQDRASRAEADRGDALALAEAASAELGRSEDALRTSLAESRTLSETLDDEKARRAVADFARAVGSDRIVALERELSGERERAREAEARAAAERDTARARAEAVAAELASVEDTLRAQVAGGVAIAAERDTALARAEAVAAELARVEDTLRAQVAGGLALAAERDTALARAEAAAAELQARAAEKRTLSEALEDEGARRAVAEYARALGAVRIDALERELAEEHARAQALEAEVAAEREAALARAEAAAIELDRAETALGSVREEVRTLAESLRDEQGRRAVLESALAVAEDRLTEARIEAAALRTEAGGRLAVSLERARADTERLRAEADAYRAAAEEARRAETALRASTSYRLTAPLRWVAYAVRGDFRSLAIGLAAALRAFLALFGLRDSGRRVGDAWWALRTGVRRRSPRRAVATWRDLRALRASPLFDAETYDRIRAGAPFPALDPVRHYVLVGSALALDPAPTFSRDFYLRFHLDVAASGVDPFVHYVRSGAREGRAVQPSRAPAPIAASAPPETPAGAEASPPPPHQLSGWRVALEPTVPDEALGLYDRRPDDAVPVEGLRGRAFLDRHRLLSDAPDLEGAVAELNACASAATSLARDQTPDVSVVIPVYGQLAYTLNCLDSLFAHASRRRFEILVADDASPDATGDWLPRVEGVRHLRAEANRGFVRNCNAAAGEARGRVLVLLNNDTRVVEGWLDALVDTLEADPERGLAGSKLFYPDGLLQEAGGIVWRDGSAWNYGREDDPNRPEYAYARQVDYVSGASIAVPTELWRELGGFDEAYVPAYCEDSDLCFRIRAAGRQTWMQPLSRVVHYEGRTSGTDLTQGAKAYQVVNQAKLYDRWKDTLGRHRPNGVDPRLERERDRTRRVLVLDATTPTPDQDAGSVTTVKVMQVFQAMGFKVVFAPVDNWLYQPRYTRPLQRDGIECLYAPYALSIEEHLRAHGAEYEVVHVFRFEVLERVRDAVRRFAPQARLVFNNMDLHYLRLQRQAEVEGSAALRRTAETTRTRELTALRTADSVCVPSSLELRLLEQAGLDRVVVMPFMTDTPALAAPAEPEGRTDVMFLGGFGHQPNADAVAWTAAEIWPALAKRFPKARFTIVGANPTAEIEALRSDRVVVTGRVDDLAPLFDRARVFLAPLRYGAGVKGKIYSAFAHAAPVVSTTIGVEGMDLEDGRHALVADTAEGLIEAVDRLFRDDDLWRSLSGAGYDFVRTAHGLEAGVRAMETALAIASRPAAADAA